MICGLQPPQRGRVRIDGDDVTQLAPFKRARRGLARTFQRLELFGLLTVRENVRLAADAARRDRPRRRSPTSSSSGWASPTWPSQRADRLPTGQARVVELARALATDPKVLLLDEPASGQDERETAAFSAVLREVAAEGVAVVLVEHDMQLVMDVCSQIHVLDFGRVLASGTPAEVQQRRGRARRLPRGRADEHAPVAARGCGPATGRSRSSTASTSTCPTGSVVAVLGPNGAGKTTLLSVIAGLHPATSGQRRAGRPPGERRPSRRPRRAPGCASSPRAAASSRTSPCARTCAWRPTPVGASRDIEDETYERFPRLAERRTQVAGTLSGGEQQMLALARGLATEPALLMLDELSMGLAPLIVEELYAQVAAIAASGVSILVVEQFARTVLGVADLAAILVQGRIGAVGRAGRDRGRAVGRLPRRHRRRTRCP